MEWLKMTGPQLRRYVAKGRCVAVLPCGSIEKHGEHLPLGTDTLNVEVVARAACEKAGAVMLPTMPYLYVNEMKASAGAVSLSAPTIFALLDEVCDEVSRNGIKKIVLLNGHGGNKALLLAYIQGLPGRGRDYAVYDLFLPACGSGSKWDRAAKMRKAKLPGGHADDGETDVTYYNFPSLVDLKAVSRDPKAGASRLDFDIAPAKAQTWWYAEYPDSLAGDPRFVSKERGRLLTEALIEGFADILKRIRDDDKVARRNALFESEASDPKRMR
jgi:creatinine amidohydrolase